MITEKLGIPDNIIESAKKIYDKTFTIINGNYDELKRSGELFYTVSNLEVSDFKIKKVHIKFIVEYTDRTDKPELAGMSIHSKQSPDSTVRKIKTIKSDELFFVVNVYMNKNNNKKNLLDLLKNMKIQFISSFAHELKHGYDDIKKNTKDIKYRLDYVSVNDYYFGVKTLVDFMFLVYYSHVAENLVRTTEVGVELKISNTKREEFVNFLNKSDVYKKLDKMANYKMDDFYNGLVGEMDRINYVLKNNDIELGTTDDNIKTFLELILIHMMNIKLGKFSGHVGRLNPMLLMFGGHEEINNVFDELRGEEKKYRNNPIKFFENQIKYINFVGTKYKKKIVKLYDLIEEEPNELHNTINNRIKNFENFNNGK